MVSCVPVIKKKKKNLVCDPDRIPFKTHLIGEAMKG